MRDGPVVVFVEVKRRRDGRAREALESVTPAKQARVVRAAVDWLARFGNPNAGVRFDVMAVTGSGSRGTPWSFDHVPDAFDAAVADGT